MSILKAAIAESQLNEVAWASFIKYINRATAILLLNCKLIFHIRERERESERRIQQLNNIES